MNPNAREFVPKGVAVYHSVAELENKVDFYKTLYESMNATNLKFHDECKKEAAYYRNAYEGLSANHTVLQNNYNTLDKKIGSMGKAMKLVMNENADLQTELRQLQEVNEELQKNLYSATTKNTMLKESLGQAEESLAQAEESLTEMCDLLNETHDSLNQTRDSLTRANDSYHEAYMSMNEAHAASIQFQNEALQAKESAAIQIRALQEELAMTKAELDSYSLDCKMKVGKMQDGVTTALQLFTTRCIEAEEQKNEAQSLLVTLYNKAATQAQEAVTLQQTLESLLQVRHQENAHASSILSSYENRILELQAYNGITSTLYIPPAPARKPIMNPELECDDDPTHDIWSLPHQTGA
jgi:chromosome segregation ATPase